MSYDQLRYHEVRQKSIHNAFQRTEGIYDQLLYWRIRSLEVDVHLSHPFDSSPATDGRDDWFVYHHTFDMYSSVHTLGEFLRICAGFHRAVPDHEVVTLFIDIKDGFPRSAGAPRSRHRFDELLRHHLGTHLYSPADLMAHGTGSSLREVVEQGGWPTLGELRGRFLVVLTGSPVQTANYLGAGETAVDRAAFVSAGISSVTDIGRDDDVVVYNMNRDHVGLAPAVRDRNLVARAYYIDDEQAWTDAVQARCHHVATDMVNARVDRWSSTTGPTGFPFQVDDGRTPLTIEPGTVVGVWARSGDIWERGDSCFFHHRVCPPDALDNSYEFVISGPNSHTEPWTKGGIMARESADPGARYFGVFRPGAGAGLRVQLRVEPGSSTTVLERHIGPTWRFGSDFDQDTLAYARLDVSDGGRRCRGFGSIDGVEWVELGSFEFEVPMALQGLAVSSHGQRRGAKYLFVVPGGGARPSFDVDRAIDAASDPAEGWVDGRGAMRWRVDRFSRSSRRARPSNGPR
jgi:hypothetical protein